MSGSAYGEIARHGATLAAALSTTGWGRLVLVVVGGYTTLMGGSAWLKGSAYGWVVVLVGVALLALAIFGAWRARREQGDERQRSSGLVGGLVGLVLTLVAGGLLLLRRRKRAGAAGVEATPPTEGDPTSPAVGQLEPVEPSSTALSPVEAGRRGVRGLIAALPGIAWGTLRGLAGGWLLLGLVGLGLGLATAASARFVLALPTWLVWTNLLVGPFVLALAGAYVGAIRGFLIALARALVDRGVVPSLYALVRPAIARVASGITRHTDPLTRREAVTRIHAHVEEALRPADAEPPKGALERFERRLAERTHTWLAVASIASAANASDRAVAMADLEQRGVEGVESGLTDTIRAAYRTQALLALAIASVLLAVPWITYMIVG